MKKYAMAACLFMAALNVCAQTKEKDSLRVIDLQDTCHRDYPGGVYQHQQRPTQKAELRPGPAVPVEHDTVRHHHQ